MVETVTYMTPRGQQWLARSRQAMRESANVTCTCYYPDGRKVYLPVDHNQDCYYYIPKGTIR